MKKSFLFLPFMAALALAGCSSDDEPAPVGDNGTTDPEVTAAGYVAVNIVQPASAGPRAALDEEGYEEGTDAENYAARGVFCVVKADGTFNGGAQVISLDKAATSTGENPYVEQIYKAVLVLEGEKAADGSSTIDASEILCILNAPVELVAKLSGEAPVIANKGALLAEIGSYNASVESNFIMTNSTYLDAEGNIVCGAKVTTDNIKPSAAEALAHPVEIYVERVVAKVRAKKGSDFTNNNATATVNGATDKTFSIKINGIAVANIPNQYYMFKDIKNLTNPLNGWEWNNSAQFRSHWGNTPSSNADFKYTNKSYENFKSIDITTAAANTELLSNYVNPNTSNQKTAIMVSAQLMDGENPADLVYLRGGYFDTEGAKNLVAQYVRNNHYVMKSTDSEGKVHYTQFDASYFTWINKVDDTSLDFLKRYEVVPQLRTAASTVDGENYWNGTVALYEPTTGVYTEAPEGIAAIQQLLKGNADKSPYKARVFTEGKCYYFVNIDQTNWKGTQDDIAAHTYDGVVRNHIYDLSINSIKGIGVPVFDPTDVIIPETPEDVPFEYLAATVKVLDWKVVSQGVDFIGQ